ncbi:MAG: helix-turn-helix domain-containing protein [Fuerstiella sp.]|nr:helix-turn-helix domain-containing protein [Fuerstiella sp.]MCP4858913.1 helix-turn-helix domain-containing protein [Fuerstiella sp.]
MDETAETDLSPKQTKVISSLVSGDSAEEAARKSGVSSRTIRRWRQSDVAFERAIRQHQNALREQVESELLQGTVSAIRTIIAIASNSDDSRALKAAQMILDRVPVHRQVGLPESELLIHMHQQRNEFS